MTTNHGVLPSSGGAGVFSGPSGGGAAGLGAIAGSTTPSTLGSSSGAGGSNDGGSTPGGSSDGGSSDGGSADGGSNDGGSGDYLPPLTVLPISHLQLDECEGSVAVDLLSLDSGVRFGVPCADGILGKSAVFSADSSDEGSRRIELAEAPRFDFGHALTVAAWVKPQGSARHLPIVSKWYAMDSFQLAIREVTDDAGNPSPRYAFSIAEPEGEWGRPTDLISPHVVVPDVWTHVAGVYRWSQDGQVGHIWLYVNGELVANTSTKVGTDGLQQSTRPVNIGYVDGTGSFIGQIDEVRLYDVALGPEVAWLYRDPAHP
jgi:hypothetical protein